MWITHFAVTVLLVAGSVSSAVALAAALTVGWQIDLPTIPIDLTVPRTYRVTCLAALTVCGTGLLIQRQLLIGSLRHRLAVRARLQEHMDGLAKLRREGLQLFTSPPAPERFDDWLARQAHWRRRVIGALKKDFTGVVLEWFEDPGLDCQTRFPHAINDEHADQLRRLARRLTVLETLIHRHSTVLKHQTPTLRSLLLAEPTATDGL